MAPKKNGFYIYIEEYKNQQANQNRFISTKTSASECSTKWANLSSEEKEIYHKIANQRNLLKEKVNSLGEPISLIEKIEMDKEKEKMFMDAVIKDTIQHLDREDTMPSKEFFLIHINYYVKVDAHHFIPAEIALVKFNLAQGVIATYHTYVAAGELPLGTLYLAESHTNNSHQLPLNFELGEKDLNKILRDIKHFLKPEGGRGDFPPLYTMPNNINTHASDSAVKAVIQDLVENDGGSNPFMVFLLPKLFFELRNACSSTGIVFPTQSIAEYELEKDLFMYYAGIACKFHEDADRPFACSLSKVIRWVFIICDHCCQDLNIALKPGRHVPINADINQEFKKDLSRRKSQWDQSDQDSTVSTSNSVRMGQPREPGSRFTSKNTINTSFKSQGAASRSPDDDDDDDRSTVYDSSSYRSGRSLSDASLQYTKDSDSGVKESSQLSIRSGRGYSDRPATSSQKADSSSQASAWGNAASSKSESSKSSIATSRSSAWGAASFGPSQDFKPISSYSNIADRNKNSSNSLVFDQSNFPAIGNSRQKENPQTAGGDDARAKEDLDRFAVWSGRGRGRGRGLATNFSQMSLKKST